MEPYKSRQRLTAGQRDGILFLISLLLLILYFRANRPFSPPWEPFELDEEMICQIQLLDSLRTVQIQNKAPRIYPFNPTFLNDYRAYILNLPTESVDRVSAFRNEGNWINSLDQFQRVSGLDDSVMQRIKPYLKLPEFRKFSNTVNRPNSAFRDGPIDLNRADQKKLMEVKGIGPVLSRRIISLRDRLGGFAHLNELFAVYGLDPSIIAKMKNYLVIKEPRNLIKIQVNEASVSDLTVIPGIDFQTAKQIWLERRRLGRYTNWDELQAIPEIGESEFALIEVYLTLE